jgi:tetratricopeptide (TPR) repeat protein
VIEYEESEPVQAKGKTEPIACWHAVRALSRVGESRRRRDATPLIGRQHERQTVIDAFERMCDELSVEALVLVGVPGIGKSRLVRELFHHLDRQPELVRWREGRSPPYGGGGTFWALAEIVKAEAGIPDSLESNAASAKLAQAVAAAVPDHDEAAWVERHLRTLVGLDTSAALFGDRKAETFAAWRRFVERLAERRPTVLVFEDLHWADDAVLDFIEHLVSWSSRVPLLLLCTARPELFERRPRWGTDAVATRILSLAPLDESETHDLLDALLREARLPAPTRTALLTAAEGNPLYAEEFVRMLVDRGNLVQRGGEWTLDEPADLPVPDSVLGIIAARLDAVPAPDKAVIQDAAVVGKVFWPSAVAVLGDRGRWAIEETLLRLEQRQLVRRRHDSSVTGDAEYVFEHSLIRDVAYRAIVRRRRAEQHRRAAAWLAALPGELNDRADAVAHHHVTALENAEAAGTATPELRRAASTALRAAAERAGSLHSHHAAARRWRQALELCAPDDPDRPSLLLAYGKALAVADEPAAPILDEAARELLDAGDRPAAAEAESTAGWLLSLAGQQEQARLRDARALELIQEAPPSYAKALILSRAGAHAVLADESRAEALRVLAEALTIAKELGLREIEAESLQFVGMTRLDAGDEEGLRDIEQALSVGVELNSPVSLSCYGNLADMHRYFGSVHEAAALHVEGEQAARRFGMPVQVRRFRAERAGDLYFRGDWDAAVAHVDEYLATIESGMPHRGAGEARLFRGRIRLARGDDAGARADARAALDFARETEEPFDLFPALALQARVLKAQPVGEVGEELEACVAELLDALARGQPFWGAWSLPDLLAALPDEHWRRLRDILASAAPQTRWYDAARSVGEGEFARAAALYGEIGSLPDEAEARLQSAAQHLSAGEDDACRSELEHALAFFRRVEAAARLRDAEALASARD